MADGKEHSAKEQKAAEKAEKKAQKKRDKEAKKAAKSANSDPYKTALKTLYWLFLIGIFGVVGWLGLEAFLLVNAGMQN